MKDSSNYHAEIPPGAGASLRPTIHSHLQQNCDASYEGDACERGGGKHDLFFICKPKSQ